MKLELTAYQPMPESLTMKLIKLFRYYVTFRNKIKMFHTLKERYNEKSWRADMNGLPLDVQ